MAPIRIASPDDVPPGALVAFEVDGTPIVVANVDGTFYALNNICSHDFALLSEGDLDTDDCTLTCPLHGSIFDLQTGAALTLPAFTPVEHYATHVDGADLFINLDESQT